MGPRDFPKNVTPCDCESDRAASRLEVGRKYTPVSMAESIRNRTIETEIQDEKERGRPKARK